jgi:Protein of unknown function (DUF2892)
MSESMPVLLSPYEATKENVMNIDKAVLSFAGFVVLLGLALGWLVNPYWYLLTAFAGLNMIQASFTGFCPAATVFKKLGVRGGCAFY